MLFLIAALYVSVAACATGIASAVQPAAAPVPRAAPVPHIALLLPLKSPVFGPAAAAVRDGFLAAAKSRPGGLPIRVYESSDESADVVALYHQAVDNGARAVAGPLTRNGVAALAAAPGINVPVLALNVGEGRLPGPMYFFGLSAEAEARQVARLAAVTGLHNATLVSDGAPLSRRLTQAFSEEWEALGGNILGEVRYSGDPAPLSEIPATKDNMIFLAAEAGRAHLMRPFLNIALPVYATSQVFNGNADTLANYDLHDVRFVDMPWLLQPDHPAVMVYPRTEPPLSTDMERLYALGIDAFRLLEITLDNTFSTHLPLDGVTGRITLSPRHQFQREALPAMFFHGRGMTPEEIAAEAAAAASAPGSAVPASPVPASP